MTGGTIAIDLSCKAYGGGQARYTRWLERAPEVKSWAVAESAMEHTSVYLQNLSRFGRPEFELVGTHTAGLAPLMAADANRIPKGDARVEELLRDIDRATEEALREEGIVVSREAKRNASAIVEKLRDGSHGWPFVHATEDGGLAFDFRRSGSSSGVLLICEPDGSGACVYEIDGSRGRQRNNDARDLWDLGLGETLRRLAAT